MKKTIHRLLITAFALCLLVALPLSAGAATRLAGNDRFETAFLVADRLKETRGVDQFDSIIIASGTNFADALGGSYLAAVEGSPILLAFKDKQNAQVKEYIYGNLIPGGTVYILGGTSAVPASMEKGLEDYEVKRLAGKDRFDTNLMILKEVGVGDREILVCTGTDFADSLSASATGNPILLVYKKLTNDQKDFLETVDGNDFCIIGGENAVSASLEEAVAAYGRVYRLAGKNRLETSTMVARRYFENPWMATVAYGWNFPDGLCGGPLAYCSNAPLLLTAKKYEQLAADYISEYGIGDGYILGGESVIPKETAKKIFPDQGEPESYFYIQFIDVGQADAALIACDGEFMLIDGGNAADSNVIYSVLRKAGVEELELVVGTHAHEDHIGGLPGAYSYATADTTLCPVTDYSTDAFETFARYADLYGGGITVPWVGDTYDLGSAQVEILGLNAGTDPNETSIILRILYGETSFLFTGDAGREGEQAVLNAGVDLQADVLKVGHHGSADSTGYPFLREVEPQYAVVSVGEGNSYGHPTDAALSRLRDADVTLYRTDMHGDIFCFSDGTDIWFETDRFPEGDVFEGSDWENTYPEDDWEDPLPDDEQDDPQPPADTGDSMTVYLPKSGTKYHRDPECSNMKNPRSVTKAEAVNQGYTPCSKCW